MHGAVVGIAWMSYTTYTSVPSTDITHAMVYWYQIIKMLRCWAWIQDTTEHPDLGIHAPRHLRLLNFSSRDLHVTMSSVYKRPSKPNNLSFSHTLFEEAMPLVPQSKMQCEVRLTHQLTPIARKAPKCFRCGGVACAVVISLKTFFQMARIRLPTA